MLKTRVTELLGIKYPILCGPMYRLSYASLVAAVSNAGGLGILASGTFESDPTPESIRREIKRTKDLTDKPFAVNVNMMGRKPMSVYQAQLTTAIEEGVQVIETVGRVPDDLIKIIQDAKVKWIHRCARVRDAITAERIGAEAVSIIGYEAAGMVGLEDVTSMIRIPATVEAVKIPVIAAGGIGDARGFVAALALGAEGVLMGTRFMVTKECVLHADAKKLLIETPENGHVMSKEMLGVGRERVVNTPFAQMLAMMEKVGVSVEEFLPFVSGSQRQDRSYIKGELNGAILHAGQVTGLMHDEPTCAELIERMVAEAEDIGKRLHNLGVF